YVGSSHRKLPPWPVEPWQLETPHRPPCCSGETFSLICGTTWLRSMPTRWLPAEEGLRPEQPASIERAPCFVSGCPRTLGGHCANSLPRIPTKHRLLTRCISTPI